MKARVKATGNLVDVKWYKHNSIGSIYADVTHIHKYYEDELDFNTVYDYWTRLEHQYAGMAMQGMLAGTYYQGLPHDRVIEDAQYIAHALVEKYKKEE